MPAGITKVTFCLLNDEVETLRQLAERRGTTMTHVLRTALATEAMLDHERREGATVLVTKDGCSLQ